jgi:hypothetical protein
MTSVCCALVGAGPMSDEAALELALRLKGVRRPGAGEKHLAVFSLCR